MCIGVFVILFLSGFTCKNACVVRTRSGGGGLRLDHTTTDLTCGARSTGFVSSEQERAERFRPSRRVYQLAMPGLLRVMK